MTPSSGAPGPPSRALAPFVRQRNVLLTTYKRDGTAVGTPVHIAVDGDHAYFRTFDRAGKVKRMRHTPQVEFAPSTARGAPTGPAVRARVRLLDPDGPEARRAARLIDRKYRFLQGVLVHTFHKLRRYRTLHYEVRVHDE